MARSNNLTTLLIAEPFPLAQEGLKSVLGGRRDLRIGAFADSEPNLQKHLNGGAADALLLNSELERTRVLKVVAGIRDAHPGLPIVVYGGPPHVHLAAHLVNRGASAYLSCFATPDHLLAALDGALGGQTFIDPRLDPVLPADGSDDEPRHRQLSDREYEVFLCLAAGKRITDIAAELELSVKTISTYRGRVLRKLDLTSNAELALYAFSHHLLPSCHGPQIR